MAPAPWPLVLCLLLLLAAAAAAVDATEEEFTEELLLRPLPDRKALAHFHFRSSTPAPGRHHHVFPKAISHLVRPSPRTPISRLPALRVPLPVVLASLASR
jgi:phosphatidylinositol glycan class T